MNYKTQSIKVNFSFFTKLTFLLILIFTVHTTNAQQGIGVTVTDPSSLLEVQSTTKGVLFSRMNTAQVNAIIAPAKGLIVYDSTVKCLKQFNGTIWACIDGASTEPWFNTQTNNSATSNTDSVYIMGKVGIGTNTPLAKLHVGGSNALILADSAVVGDKGGSKFYVGGGGITHLGFGWENIGIINTFKSSGAGNTNLELNMKNGAADFFLVNGQLNSMYQSKFAMASGNVGVGVPSGTTVPSNKLHVIAAANPVRFEGLQGGAASDSIITTDATGVLRKRTVADVTSGDWHITGNNNVLDSSINFLGTINNVPLNFRINNQKAGRISPGGDAFFGYQAGNVNNGLRNTGIGQQALASNTIGNDNTAVGLQSLFANKNGTFNTAVGRWTLYTNDSGTNNTALGAQALLNNTKGSFNVSVGSQSMGFNTTGDFNSASGYGALYNNTTGQRNVAMGCGALYGGITNFGNVGIGWNSLYSNISGGLNVALGYDAGFKNRLGNSNFYGGTGAGYSDSLGSNNTFIGANSNVPNTSTNISYASAIGAGSIVSQSNTVILGRTTDNTGIGNTAPTNKLHVTATSNPIRLEGLQLGASSDSILTTESTGVVRFRAASSVLAGATTNAIALSAPDTLTTTVNGVVSNKIGLSAIEPWYNQATGKGATANTQNIYQTARVSIGTNNPAHKFSVYQTLDTADFATSRINTNYSSSTIPLKPSYTHVYNDITINSSLNNGSASIDGAINRVNKYGSGSIGYIKGAFNVAYNYGSGAISSYAIGAYNTTVNLIGASGTIAEAYGAFNYVNTESGSNANITNAYGSYNSVANRSSATTTNAYGGIFNVIDTGVLSTVNAYGVYINTLDALALKYGIYQAKQNAKNYLGDTLCINTTAPTAYFDVNGNARIRTIPSGANSDSVLTTDASGNIRKRSTLDIASNNEPWFDGTTNLGATSNTQNIYQMGNVGIGILPSATAALNVSASAGNVALVARGSNNNYTESIIAGATTGQSYGSLITAGSNSNDVAFHVRNITATNPIIFARGDGYVGLGNSNPVCKLDVTGLGSTRIRIKGTGQGYTNAVLDLVATTDSLARGTGVTMSDSISGTQWYAGRPYAGGFTYNDVFVIQRKNAYLSPDDASAYYTGGGVANASNFLTIKNNGNVGINTTTPNAKLNIVDNSATYATYVAQSNAAGSGIYAQAPAIAIYANATGGVNSTAIYGYNNTGGNGVVGTSTIGAGGLFYTNATINGSYALVGTAQNVSGASGVGGGLFVSQSGTYLAGGYQNGNGGVSNGNFGVAGVLSKSSGTFKIDHPQDPENKYLIHSFVESPDMMNVYNGNITTDANGNATVTLPTYFEAENKDFRYQLTIVDQTQFAQVRVAQKIANNAFIIKTDKPNIEVSWQVTGVRQDAWANAHRVETKEPENKGKYLNPEVFGKSKSKGIYYIDPKTLEVPTNNAPVSK
jgi:hypothetical protein